jgi:hypothetical protein
MILNTPRLIRERKTIQSMLLLYCQDNHHTAENLCAECQQMSDYAMQRLDKCPYQSAKPTCNKCLIHCYQPAMQVRIRQVMRYAGPRMLTRHPVLAILHLLDGFTSKPGKPRLRKKNKKQS